MPGDKSKFHVCGRCGKRGVSDFRGYGGSKYHRIVKCRACHAEYPKHLVAPISAARIEEIAQSFASLPSLLRH